MVRDSFITVGFCSNAPASPIDPAAVAGINPYGTGHLIRLGQYHLDVDRQPPQLQYDLPIIPLDES